MPAADFVIFFTCAFCHSRVTDMLDEIKRIQSGLKTGAELIIGSCLPKTDSARLQTVFKGRTIDPMDFSALDDLPGVTVRFDTILEQRGQAARCISEPQPLNSAARRAAMKRYIARKAVSFVRCGRRMTGLQAPIAISPEKRKIFFLAAGCRRQCSYCAIRFATGRLRSKPLDWVVWQFKESLHQGFGKFELYADSLGDYGLDIGTDLGNLLTRLLHMREGFSIGLYDLHPASFIKHYESIKALCQAGRVHFLYVPLQSGNDRIMKLMRRPCNARMLKENMLQIKNLGGIFLQTSVIVGFPGETNEEFDDTLDFLRAVDYDDVYVHFYSDMPGTESSKMNDKVDKQVMQIRMNKILEAGIKNQIGETKHEWENIPVEK